MTHFTTSLSQSVKLIVLSMLLVFSHNLLKSQTVWEVIQASPDHTTLEAAIEAAELEGTLSGAGPFTVFAPTDEAFDALPGGLLDDLLADPSGDLTDILLYHVVAATAMAADISNGDVFETVLGKNIVISIDGDGNVFVNNAQVTVTDLEADNGVVHVIDAVLLPRTTVADIIIGSDAHTTLAAAVAAANLTVTLSNDGPFTVFAPTDEAFEALPEGLVAELLEDPSGDLTDILLYHVVGAQALSTELADGDTFTTLLGKDITVTINAEGEVFINDAQVVMADLMADNGVVHVIDAVLTPPVITVVDIILGSEAHTTLAAAVAAAGLVDALSAEGPFTVFAPTDEAFEALPEGLLEALLEDPSGDLTDILLYHVVGAQALSTELSDGDTFTTLLGKDITVTINAEGEVFINDAQVVIADLMADNGVVHVIDALLTPPVITVVDIILGSEAHTTLAAAVAAAGLVDALSAEGPFTVFAPTDEAFEVLPEGLLEALLEDPSGDLTDILLYHVVGGQALSTDLTDGQMIETLLGENITVTINAEGEVFINNAMVIVADIMADNGVVHVINAVLVPDTSTNTEDIIADFTNLNIYPNPVRDRLNINMELQSANTVTIEIFNLLGSRVYSRQMGTRSGSFVENISIDSFPRGMYIINITTGNETKSRKINIVK